MSTMNSPKGSEATEARESVSALERGFAVLDCFRPSVPALSHQQISRLTGLPKATVSRILQTLTKLGYLQETHSDGRFRLTAATLSAGYAYLSNIDVLSTAQPFMTELAEHSLATVNLAAPSGDHLVVVDTRRSVSAIVAMNVSIGFQFPILLTAVGRAYLAGLDESVRDQLVATLCRQEPPDQRKALKAAIARAVSEYQERGYCALWGEWRPGVNSVATFVRSGVAPSLYVLNCGGPALQLTRTAIEEDIGPRLVEIAQKITQTVNVQWRPKNEA